MLSIKILIRKIKKRFIKHENRSWSREDIPSKANRMIKIDKKGS